MRAIEPRRSCCLWILASSSSSSPLTSPLPYSLLSRPRSLSSLAPVRRWSIPRTIIVQNTASTALWSMSPRKRGSTSATSSRKRPPLSSAVPHAAASTKKRATTTHVTHLTAGVDDLQRQIVDNLHQRATQATKDWFTNYVKGTTWIGCKLPVVRQCVQEAIPPIKKKKKTAKTESTTTAQPWSTELLLDTAVRLLEQRECDVKLAGILILSECFPTQALCTTTVLDRLERCVLQPNMVPDWSSADWFAMKHGTNLWYRRCGVIPFVQYYNHRDVLPDDIGLRVVQACETSLLTSPTERFTQTGVAWVLRYMLSPKTATKPEREAAAAMVVKHGALWSTEAKKSLTEKLSKTDPLAAKIRQLGN